MSGRGHEIRVVEEKKVPRMGRYVVQEDRRQRELTKTDIWAMLWHLDVIKVQLFILKLRSSINKGEKKLLKDILEAWAE